MIDVSYMLHQYKRDQDPYDNFSLDEGTENTGNYDVSSSRDFYDFMTAGVDPDQYKNELLKLLIQLSSISNGIFEVIEKINNNELIHREYSIPLVSLLNAKELKHNLYDIYPDKQFCIQEDFVEE